MDILNAVPLPFRRHLAESDESITRHLNPAKVLELTANKLESLLPGLMVAGMMDSNIWAPLLTGGASDVVCFSDFFVVCQYVFVVFLLKSSPLYCLHQITNFLTDSIAERNKLSEERRLQEVDPCSDAGNGLIDCLVNDLIGPEEIICTYEYRNASRLVSLLSNSSDLHSLLQPSSPTRSFRSAS